VIIGNGTSAPTFVAPGTSGNVLTSNGSAWASTAPAGGGVTSLNGQTGAITDTTFNVIGSYSAGGVTGPGLAISPGATYAGSSVVRRNSADLYTGLRVWSAGDGTVSLGLSGTWRAMTASRNSNTCPCSGNYVVATNLWVRIS
jgi:hypothetical protein